MHNIFFVNRPNGHQTQETPSHQYLDDRTGDDQRLVLRTPEISTSRTSVD